jgi:dTDP-glucose pyrophosphorylase
MKKLILDITIYRSTTILVALRKMDQTKRKLLIVLKNDDTFFSLLSIGDIQRSIINNAPLDSAIDHILRNDVTVANSTDDILVVKERMKARRNEFMPIIDSKNRIINVIFWEDLFQEKQDVGQFKLPIVIMAGGMGSRLKPITNVIPKPLIPINDKTIIEDIMDRFVHQGCSEFYLSVNYKADLIKYYFDDLANKAYKINYFQEEKPLGTAGSLSLLKGKIQETFFVSNCDILIDQDYAEILKYHRANKNKITIVAALKHYPLPYGTIETGNNGVLIELTEKPDLTFKINSGMYIIEPEVLNEIPDNEFYHITDLIENRKKKGDRVGVFPVSEKSWRDIGNWEDYLKTFNYQKQ